MLNASDLILKFLQEEPDPEPLTKLVFDYAKQSKKDKWQCFCNVFIEGKITVVIQDPTDKEYIGYACGEITKEDDLFLHHGFLTVPITGRPQLLDNIARMVSDTFNRKINQIVCNSDMNPRLWEKWGYKVSPTKIFVRKIGE